MHGELVDSHEEFQDWQEPVHNCWNCGRRGVLFRGTFMICYLCDVRWTRWQKPLTVVAYAPLYETL